MWKAVKAFRKYLNKLNVSEMIMITKKESNTTNNDKYTKLTTYEISILNHPILKIDKNTYIHTPYPYSIT